VGQVAVLGNLVAMGAIQLFLLTLLLYITLLVLAVEE
jgi:hypothetical protein